MKKTLFFLLVALFAIGYTAKADANVIDTVFIRLSDKYATGWNGNNLLVTYTNTNSENVELVLTLSSGESAEFVVDNIKDNTDVQVTWTGGETSRYSFAFYYENNVKLYKSPKNGMGAGFQDTFLYSVEYATSNRTISLVKNPEEGGFVYNGGEYAAGSYMTMLAAPNTTLGYVFKTWSSDDNEIETVKLTKEIFVEDDAEYVANFEKFYGIYVGDEGDSLCENLPTTTASKYAISQQIFTSDELPHGIINSIKIYNGGAKKSRKYDIYLKKTDKSSFANSTDWITVTSADMCYNATSNVSIEQGEWKEFVLNSPFNFDEGNLAVLIYDRRNSASAGQSCRVFDAQSNQTLFAHGASSYVPTDMGSIDGTLTTLKNQIIFGYNYDVTVVSNDESKGTVTGGGTYYNGNECTVTATANAGYEFVNWVVGGNVFSTENPCTFPVEDNTNIIAVFDNLSTYWNARNFGYNMGISGIISIDGVPQNNPMLEIGAFCGEEIRGSYILEPFPLTPDVYVVSLPIGSDNNDTNHPDTITFKLYDHSLDSVLDLRCAEKVPFVNQQMIGSYFEGWHVFEFSNKLMVNVTINPEGAGSVQGVEEYYYLGDVATLTATANDGYAFVNWIIDGITVSTNPVSFEVNNNVDVVANYNYKHSMNLPEGFTWWSTYIELNGINGLTMLEESLGDKGRVIWGQGPYTQNQTPGAGNIWYGGLTSITNEKCYTIVVSDTCRAVMTGDIVNPADKTITVLSDWTWIGYPVNETRSVSEALANLTPEVGDVINGQGWFCTYYGGAYGWYPNNNVTVFAPGRGFHYKSLADTTKTFVYSNVTSKGNDIDVEGYEYYWNNDIYAYPDNMCIIATALVSEVEQYNGDLEVGAFVNGECRGRVKLEYFEPLDRYYAMLAVAGENGDVIEFGIVDPKNNRISLESRNEIVFDNKEVIGTIDKPYELYFDEMVDINRSKLVLFPNPVKRNETVSFNIPDDEIIKEVVITNAVGAVVSHKATSLNMIAEGLPMSGIYMVKAVCISGNVYIGKLIVK